MNYKSLVAVLTENPPAVEILIPLTPDIDESTYCLVAAPSARLGFAFKIRLPVIVPPATFNFKASYVSVYVLLTASFPVVGVATFVSFLLFSEISAVGTEVPSSFRYRLSAADCVNDPPVAVLTAESTYVLLQRS